MEDRFELNLDDLMESLMNGIKKDKDFEDLVQLKSDLHRDIFIGDIYDGVGRDVEKLIWYWNTVDNEKDIPVPERKPINLIVDSMGGSLLDAFTIIDAIRLSKTPVHAYVIGAAYSAGFFITISCHKRYGYKHSSYVFHEGSVGNGGTSGQFENFAAFYKKQLGQLKDLVIENTNIEEEEYDKIKRDDIWYDAYEALDKGIIDEVL